MIKRVTQSSAKKQSETNTAKIIRSISVRRLVCYKPCLLRVLGRNFTGFNVVIWQYQFNLNEYMQSSEDKKN